MWTNMWSKPPLLGFHLLWLLKKQIKRCEYIQRRSPPPHREQCIFIWSLCIQMNNASRDYKHNSAKKKKNGGGRERRRNSRVQQYKPRSRSPHMRRLATILKEQFTPKWKCCHHYLHSHVCKSNSTEEDTTNKQKQISSLSAKAHWPHYVAQAVSRYVTVICRPFWIANHSLLQLSEMEV